MCRLIGATASATRSIARRRTILASHASTTQFLIVLAAAFRTRYARLQSAQLVALAIVSLDQYQRHKDHNHRRCSGSGKHVGHNVRDIRSLLGQLDTRGRHARITQILDTIANASVQHVETDASLDVVLHAAVLVDIPRHIGGRLALGVV